MNIEEQVREFHETFGALVNESPTLIDKGEFGLRVRMTNEEYHEMMDAYEEGDLVEVYDAILDQIYLLVGTGVAMGLPIIEGLDEVHRSNMSKLGEDGKPIYREDGKVLKGPNYFRPNLARILEQATKAGGT